MTYLKMGDDLKAPKELVCPICSAPLTPIRSSAWSKRADGWIATEIEFSCESEPDIDSKEWRGWFRNHFCMPYVHWLPLHHRLLQWMERTYRFVDDGEAGGK